MESAVLIGKSKADMSIILALAKKLGFGVKKLSETDMEEIGLINAMRTGRTGDFIDINHYLKKLKSK